MSKTFNITILDVVSGPPTLEKNRLLEMLRQDAFKEEDIAQEKKQGWIGYNEINELAHHEASVIRGDYLAFAFRTDTRKIPAMLFKKELDLAIRQEKKNSKKDFVPRLRKNELGEQIKIRLLAKIAPVPKLTNIVWDTQEKTIYVYSVSTNEIEQIQEKLFFTFNLKTLERETDSESAPMHYFLLWLWYNSENGDGTLTKDRLVQVGETVCMVDSDCTAKVSVQNSIDEARYALSLGKNIQQLAVQITAKDELVYWDMKLSTNLSRVQSLKLPTAFINDDDKEALFFEQHAFIHEIYKIILSAYEKSTTDYNLGSKALDSWRQQAMTDMLYV